MRRASITEAKNRLSALIDQVRAGETILIVDRGTPVARLEPAAGQPTNQAGRLERLERSGLVRRATRPLAPDFLSRPRPSLADGATLLDAVLDERRHDR